MLLQQQLRLMMWLQSRASRDFQQRRNAACTHTALNFQLHTSCVELWDAWERTLCSWQVAAKAAAVGTAAKVVVGLGGSKLLSNQDRVTNL
jgi:hypothetical protein